MWYLDDTQAKRSSFKKIHKNHLDEYASCFANLDKIITILNSGCKFKEFKVGFFRSEGAGLYRIGQTGVRSPKEIRLYVYAEPANETLYILDIGTKESQSKDIRETKARIKRIRTALKEHR